MKTFSSYHPFVLFTYFTVVIGFTMFFMHPIYLGLSLFHALVLVGILSGKRQFLKSFVFSLPMFFIIALSNPLFSHDGLTVILFVNDKPITLESVFYGFAVASMIIAVVYWFHAVNQIMTSEKIIYLFGKFIPAIALIISMTLRLIPKAKQQLEKIRNAQIAMGMDEKTGSVFQRIKNGMRTISILITWMLENGVDTADSMRVRGYGLRGRTTYSTYRFQKRDGYLLSIILIASMWILYGSFLNINSFHYYPIIKQVDISFQAVVCYFGFFILSALPLIIEVKEEIKWRYFQSKI